MSRAARSRPQRFPRPPVLRPCAIRASDRPCRARHQGVEGGPPETDAPFSRNLRRRPPDQGRTMSPRYSALRILREGLGGHKGWTQAWRRRSRSRPTTPSIIGGGGHGLAAAYYLAKNHGITKRRRDREGLDRRRQHRAQHHDRALQLFLSRERRAVRFRAAALRRPVAGAQLQRDAVAARHARRLRTATAQMEIAARLANAMQINGVDAELFEAAADARKAAAR